MIRRSDPRALLPDEGARAGNESRRHVIKPRPGSPNYVESHQHAAQLVAREPRKTDHAGKPRKTEPKLTAKEVLELFRLDRMQVRATLWDYHRQ